MYARDADRRSSTHSTQMMWEQLDTPAGDYLDNLDHSVIWIEARDQGQAEVFSYVHVTERDGARRSDGWRPELTPVTIMRTIRYVVEIFQDRGRGSPGTPTLPTGMWMLRRSQRPDIARDVAIAVQEGAPHEQVQVKAVSPHGDRVRPHSLRRLGCSWGSR